MNLSLKPELERFVAEKVKTGQCSDASDVVNGALPSLRDQEPFAPEQEARLKREALKGLEELDRGEVSDFDAASIIAQQRRRLKDRKGA